MQETISSTLRNRMLTAAEELHKNDEAFKKASNKDFFIWLAIFVALALAVRMFVFEPVLVDGDSMYPTLLHGERMFVEKITYLIESPKRGDIIICRYPGYVENCVKRVIGRPGDTVSVVGGVVYINGQPLDESAYWQDEIWWDMDPVKVPEKCVFVIGDNRNHSTDSREKIIGPIPYSQVRGKVHSIMWPIGEIRNVYKGASPMVGVPYAPKLNFTWDK